MTQIINKLHLNLCYNVCQVNRRPYWRTHHSVGLPWACLPISNHADIATLKCSFQDFKPQVSEDLRQQRKDYLKMRKIQRGKQFFHTKVVVVNLYYRFTMNIKSLNRWDIEQSRYLLLGCKRGTSSVKWVVWKIIWKGFPYTLELVHSNCGLKL